MPMPFNRINPSFITTPGGRLRSTLGAGALAITMAVALVGGATTLTSPALAEVPLATAPVSFADTIERVKPSVVSVRVETRDESPNFRFNRREFFPELPEGHPLERFFRRFGEEDFGDRQPRRYRRGFGSGSGFIVSADGFVVTNHHVVKDAEEVTVQMEDGDEFKAQIVGTDPKTDLALLKIDAEKDLPFVKLATRDVRVGDWVIAIGNPFGFLGNSVTAGIVSARGRDNIGSSLNDFIQIDAAVNKGNSGGPAFNLSGDVVGVNTAIFSPSGGNVGIAFAIPAETVRTVIDQLKDNGSVTRGWLGVRIQPVTKDIAESIGLAEAHGALVAETEKDTPAARAGVKVGDAIIAVDADRIDSPKALARKIASLAPGTKVRVKVWRDNSEKTIAVELGTLPATETLASRESSAKPSPKATIAQLGLTLRRDSQTDQLVVVDVDPDGQAAQKGVRRGDIVADVSGKKVETLADVEAAIGQAQSEGRKAVLMRLKSGEASRFVAIPIKSS